MTVTDTPETEDEELVRISFLLTKAERHRMKVRAAEEGKTMSEVLRAAVVAYYSK